MTRREETVLCRVRIGHKRITHGFLMNRGEPPVCDVCHEALTLQHVLSSCRRYSGTGRRCRMSATLSEVRGDQEINVDGFFS